MLPEGVDQVFFRPTHARAVAGGDNGSVEGFEEGDDLSWPRPSCDLGLPVLGSRRAAVGGHVRMEGGEDLIARGPAPAGRLGLEPGGGDAGGVGAEEETDGIGLWVGPVSGSTTAVSPLLGCRRPSVGLGPGLEGSDGFRLRPGGVRRPCATAA
jgi:hypothetical protein